MKLLVFLPAFNEEKTIGDIIKRVPRQITGIKIVDVLVVDDGSTDRTGEIASEAGANVVTHEYNKGLGMAFQRGVKEALQGGYDIMVNIDADGQFEAMDIPKLVEPIVNQKADFVTASRFIDPNMIPKMSSLKRWGNRRVSRLISFIAKKKYYDVSCGFRAFSRVVLLNLNLFSKFTYTHETFLNVIFKDLHILEVPIEVRGEREFGNSKIADSLFKYGYNIFNTIFRTILDYKPLKFFGWAGVFLFGIGAALDLFVVGRLLFLGEITPYKSVGFAGLALNIFGMLLLIVGLLADMINKTRLTQERMLYYQKKKMYQR
ncbi:glycosyltransferase family 2 protein [Patescibacteria group bacterium]|nr:glycosyltransferase family 2 protein [Patescibacteria group bacterium]